MSARIVIVSVAAGLLAWPALGQEEAAQEAASSPDWLQFACVVDNRHSVASERLPVDRPARLWAALDRLAGSGEISHCWAWNDSCAPRRVERDEAPAAACGGGAAAEGRLTIRWQAPQDDGGAPTGTGDAVGRVQVVAAPAEMWHSVSFSLLPRFVASADAGQVAVPRSAEPWRVFAYAEGDAENARQALASKWRWRDVAPGANAVDLSLAPAADLAVRVLADRAPLLNARLSLVRPGRFGSGRGAELIGFESVDGDGRASLDVTEGEPSLVVVTSPTRAAVAFQRHADVPAVVDLDAGHAVSGTAVDEAGEPVAGAEILGLSWIPDGGGLMQRHAARTGADGRFLLAGFPSGTALLRTEGDDLTFSRQLEVEDSIDLGSVVLASPEQVWLAVVDRDRQVPVGGARVLPSGGYWTPVNDDGLVRLTLVLGRNVEISADGFSSTRMALPAEVGETADDPFRVELAPAFVVKGRYVAADGMTPAVNGRRVIRSTNVFRPGALGADGSFSSDLEPGEYELELSAGNAGTKRLTFSGSRGEVRDLGTIVAPVSAGVSGHVVNPEYVPVAEATVSRLRSSEIDPVMAWTLGDIDRVTTDAEGRFELFGLEPGMSNLRVEAEGFAPLEVEVEAQELNLVDIGTVELSRGRRVLVRSDVGEGQVVLDVGGIGHPRDLMKETLRAGEATVEAVPDGAFQVQVVEDGVPVCEREEEKATGDMAVRCDRSTIAVSGRVTIGNHPGSGMLLWRQEAKAGLMGGFIESRGGPMPRRQTISNRPQERQAMLDGEGRYRIEAVLPGAWEVIWAPLDGGRQDAREVTVPDGPGDVVALDFDYGGVSVAGLVRMADGSPASRASVTVFPGRRVVSTDEAGRFRAMGLMPGSYQLRARLVDFRSRPIVDARSRLVEVELQAGENETVELVLMDMDESPSDELTVRLAGVSSGFCFVETETGLSRMVRIESGEARHRLTPPLTERLRVACRADGHWAFTPWRDLRAALDDGVELEPYESTSTITLAGGTAGGVPVEIVGPGGWDLGSLRIWFGGGKTFRAGESIPNLPAGSYTVRWGGQSRMVNTERRRAVEVEIGD